MLLTADDLAALASTGALVFHDPAGRPAIVRHEQGQQSNSNLVKSLLASKVKRGERETND